MQAKFDRLKLKRAYDAPSQDDGLRILVDRLWPRGIKKEALKMDLWLKEVAPSAPLRKWYSHDPEKWGEFQKAYTAELKHNAQAVDPIIAALREGTVTLIYAAHDTEHSHVLCLKRFIEKQL